MGYGRLARQTVLSFLLDTVVWDVRLMPWAAFLFPQGENWPENVASTEEGRATGY